MSTPPTLHRGMVHFFLFNSQPCTMSLVVISQVTMMVTMITMTVMMKSVSWLLCCSKWDVNVLDALLPKLLPKLHSNTLRADDVSWKLAAVQGFLLKFHLQVYHQLSQTLVILCIHGPFILYTLICCYG